MEQAYPAFIVDTNDGSEHPFLVCVPDMDIFTQGDNFIDAIYMARDAIGLTGISMEDNHEEIPVPSDKDDLIKKLRDGSKIVDFSSGILTYVDIDFDDYRKRLDSKDNIPIYNYA